jgi:plasmid stability protein
MATLIVELPAETYEQLKQRAVTAGKSPEALSRELLETALGENGAP